MNLSGLSLRDLEYVVAVADHGSFVRAAEQCHVAQPSLSMQVSKVEARLNTALFERTTRRLIVTPNGQRVVEQMRRVLVEARAIFALAGESQKPFGAVLRLSAISTLGPYVFPCILRDLRSRYPGLSLVLGEGKTEDLLRALLQGDIDAALVSTHRSETGVTGMPIFREPFVLACPEDHPACAPDGGGWEGLTARERLLLDEGHCLRDQALAACRLADRRQVQSVEATGLHTLVQMVDNGLGVTLLPQLAIDGGILKGTAIRILPTTGQTPSREIGLVWRRGTGRQREFMLLANVLTQLVEERSGLKSIFPLNSLEITHLVDSGPLPLFSLQERKELKMNRMNHSRIETKNTLPQSIRIQSVGLLNRNLALAIDLERQAKQAHWNVKGPNFIALHELFDKVAEAAEEFTDLLAERATALGGTAEGRVHAVAESSSLPRYPGEIFSGQEHGDALSTALATFGKTAREAIDEAERFGDADTADVFTGISRETDKQLWLVEAHLYS